MLRASWARLWAHKDPVLDGWMDGWVAVEQEQPLGLLVLSEEVDLFYKLPVFHLTASAVSLCV